MAGKFGGKGQDEDHEKRLELKMSTYIKEMDAEVRERFMALKVMEDMMRDVDEEETKEIRKLEYQYESLYKDIYAQRDGIVSGSTDIDQKLIEQFDTRAKKLIEDGDYEKVEQIVCDVKAIKNMPKGIPNFWIRIMQNH
jgi:hypothetical protein